MSKPIVADHHQHGRFFTRRARLFFVCWQVEVLGPASVRPGHKDTPVGHMKLIRKYAGTFRSRGSVADYPFDHQFLNIIVRACLLHVCVFALCLLSVCFVCTWCVLSGWCLVCVCVCVCARRCPPMPDCVLTVGTSSRLPCAFI